MSRFASPERDTTVLRRVRAGQAGWRSRNSGRAVSTTSSGTLVRLSARWARNSTSVSDGPVEVLDDEDRGRRLRDQLEEAPPRGERLVLGRGLRLRPQAHERREAVDHPGPDPRVGLGQAASSLERRTAWSSVSMMRAWA